MGYEKAPPKLTFYKAFFFAQWKFLIHTIVQYMSAKRTAWNEFSSSMASVVICLATGGCIQQGEIAELDADEDVTLVDVDTAVEIDADIQERMEEDVIAVKEINFPEPEPTVFNDEEVTMTMAQTLIKIKAKKARILDEQMAKRLQVKEIEQAAAREKQEKEELERAKVLQQLYDQKQENIDWNFVAEKMQEKHLDNIRNYQNLNRKIVSIAQARKNMIVYLKNMTGFKITHFKGMTYDQVKPIFEKEYKKVQIFFKPDRDEEPTKKRVAEETLLQESFKKLRAKVEVLGSYSIQDTPTDDPKEMSKEYVKNMLQIVLVAEFKIKALQVKYPLIDWEIYSERSRTYYKIIRVGGITQAYQSFEDMVKNFNREDLDALWRLRKEKFSTSMPIEDKEKALWVELKRLYEHNTADVFWKLQRYMHDPLTWKLYTKYGAHQVSSTRRHDIFMFPEKDYPLTDAVLLLMLSIKLQVDEDCE
nr:hypothetical protein [Tanacetum cinerariifolium]